MCNRSYNMKNINNYYKVVGLGLLNVVIPNTGQVGAEDIFSQVSEVLPDEYTEVLSSATLDEFIAETGVSIQENKLVTDIGYEILTSDGNSLLSGNAGLFCTTTGVCASSEVNLNAEIFQNPSIEKNYISVIQSRLPDTSEFAITVTGTSIQGIRKLDNNNNVEFQLLNSGQILYTNKNSNTIPGVFEISFINEDEEFNPLDFTEEELRELALENNISQEQLNSWIEQLNQ